MDKKHLSLLIPAALIPYISLTSVIFLWFVAPFVYVYIPWEHVQQYFIFYYIGLILLFCLVAAVLGIIGFAKSIREKWDAIPMAKTVMWIKLCQIPAYVAIFMLGMIMAITIFTIPFAIALFLLDCLALTVTGLLNFSAVLAACREGKTTWKKSWWVAALQMVFCADVVASVIFYFCLQRSVQPTEDTQ